MFLAMSDDSVKSVHMGVGNAIEKHHYTSPDCAIITLNSSLYYLDYFAILIKQISPDVCHTHVP